MIKVKPLVCDTIIPVNSTLTERIERTNQCAKTLFAQNIGSVFFCKGFVRVTDTQQASRRSALGLWQNETMPCTLLGFIHVQDVFKNDNEFQCLFENKSLAGKILQVSSVAYYNGYEDLNLKNNTAILYKFLCADGIFYHYAHPVLRWLNHPLVLNNDWRTIRDENCTMRIHFDEIDLLIHKE